MFQILNRGILVNGINETIMVYITLKQMWMGLFICFCISQSQAD